MKIVVITGPYFKTKIDTKTTKLLSKSELRYVTNNKSGVLYKARCIRLAEARELMRRKYQSLLVM